MAKNKGKQFEKVFESDFKGTVGKCIDRLIDVQGGYLGIRNICDYVGYKKPSIFYLECKCHEGNTFPLSNFTQYDKLVVKVGEPGVRAGVVLWMIDHDKVLYLPVSFFTYLKENNYKSFNIKMLRDDNLKQMFVEIPSSKKRVFMESDYSILTTLEDGF